MVTSCAAHGCTKRLLPGKKHGVTFHRFPKNEARRKLWEAAVGRSVGHPDDWRAKSSAQLCSEHFTPECFDRTGQTTRLREEAIPSIFEHNPPATKQGKSKRQRNIKQEPPSTAVKERTASSGKEDVTPTQAEKKRRSAAEQAIAVSPKKEDVTPTQAEKKRRSAAEQAITEPPKKARKQSQNGTASPTRTVTSSANVSSPSKIPSASTSTRSRETSVNGKSSRETSASSTTSRETAAYNTTSPATPTNSTTSPETSTSSESSLEMSANNPSRSVATSNGIHANSSDHLYASTLKKTELSSSSLVPGQVAEKATGTHKKKRTPLHCLLQWRVTELQDKIDSLNKKVKVLAKKNIKMEERRSKARKLLVEFKKRHPAPEPVLESVQLKKQRSETDFIIDILEAMLSSDES